MWEIKRTVKCGKYIYAVVPEHPNANKFGYIYLHRVIVENNIGRILNDDEIVHHKDYDTKNNNIENLEFMNQSEHARKHGLEKGRVMCLIICPQCKNVFEREKNKTHLIKPSKLKATFCSPRCRGLFSQKIQSNSGITDEMVKSISESVLKEYRKLLS
ncbi:MAG TPA: HNH endonuclease signature motif containing protein [Chitinophagales bacterium]|nr:HNH endonuclease signature motif containing protein [Chitinophagales bacterium]